MDLVFDKSLIAHACSSSDYLEKGSKINHMVKMFVNFSLHKTGLQNGIQEQDCKTLQLSWLDHVPIPEIPPPSSLCGPRGTLGATHVSLMWRSQTTISSPPVWGVPAPRSTLGPPPEGSASVVL
nr:uncharacterized protein LOC129380592 [Dermacentor andersoni]